MRVDYIHLFSDDVFISDSLGYFLREKLSLTRRTDLYTYKHDSELSLVPTLKEREHLIYTLGDNKMADVLTIVSSKAKHQGVMQTFWSEIQGLEYHAGIGNNFVEKNDYPRQIDEVLEKL